MKKQWMTISCMLILSVSLLAGCGTNSNNDVPEDNPPMNENEQLPEDNLNMPDNEDLPDDNLNNDNQREDNNL